MKSLLLSAILGIAGYSAYNHYHSSDIVGEWWLDVDTMAERWSQRGQSPEWISEFRQNNSGGQTKTLITSTEVTITLRGRPVTTPYQVLSKSGNCTLLKLEGTGDELNHCVSGRFLEVSHSRSKLVQKFVRH